MTTRFRLMLPPQRICTRSRRTPIGPLLSAHVSKQISVEIPCTRSGDERATISMQGRAPSDGRVLREGRGQVEGVNTAFLFTTPPSVFSLFPFTQPCLMRWSVAVSRSRRSTMPSFRGTMCGMSESCPVCSLCSAIIVAGVGLYPCRLMP
jgi:hypothetical protein